MMSQTNVLIIQPPLVQLNTPYPAGAYLKSFFSKIKKENSQWNIGSIQWIDGCNLLFHKIFCQEGLTHIFSVTEEKALSQAERWEKEGRVNEAFNVRRYLSQQDAWIRWIDSIVAILLGRGQEVAHEFVASPGVPRGQHMENFMASLDGLPSVDEGLILASLALADLADYIGAFFDSSFELVRYGESLATSHQGFEVVEEGLQAPILQDFYHPVVDEILKGVEREGRVLVCVSCPFPGTLPAALYTCKRIKEELGRRCFVVMGGGYVNTELRQVKEPKLAAYIDALSYDRGYGSYWDFFCRLEELEGGEVQLQQTADEQFPQGIKAFPLYKMKFFSEEDLSGMNTDEERVRTDPVSTGQLSLSGVGETSYQSKVVAVENECTFSLCPDFTDIDFSLYPRLADSTNPMHRLWSHGAWLKAYLAHGCYWHQCAFCDTSLDYVCGYRKVNLQSLYQGLSSQAQKLGVQGIHLVDEAAPPSALRDFALENLRSQRPLIFWGNIRYEKVFSRDLADLLSHGGLRAVSGGIEIASGTGLDVIQKGTDLDSIVAACAAFKEAGILTHAYMIYGYWKESPQILIDSMETLRQLFATGLLDSAFWHKFVLTRHSRVFNEWKDGLHPELRPLGLEQDENSIFATNDIRFDGEEKSEKYGEPLNRALAAWMAGQALNKPVGKWFPFPMPRPSVPDTLVEEAIVKYEKQRDSSYKDYDNFCTNWKNYCWLGGKVFVSPCGGGWQLSWTYMGELLSCEFKGKDGKDSAEMVASWLNSASKIRATKTGTKDGTVQEKVAPACIKSVYKDLRRGGLCRIP